MNQLALAVHHLAGKEEDITDFGLEPLEEEAIEVIGGLIQMENRDISEYQAEVNGPVNWLILPPSISSHSI